MGSNTLATEAATVKVDTSGRVVAFLGTTSHGQSIETTMAQIVAEHLGVAYDDVTIVQADSQSTPYGPGTGGSRTAVVAGGAAREATVAVREKVAHRRRAHDGSCARRPRDRRERGVGARDAVEVGDHAATSPSTRSSTPTSSPPSIGSGLEATVPLPTDAVPHVVERHPHLRGRGRRRRAGMPEVMRYIVSEDCGKMINPMVVEGQIFGGVVQGIGGVLLEDFVYDADGNPLTTTFMDYLPPTTSEVPQIEVGHIETDSTTNPGGYKGMGEGGAIGAHAAVANAVADALRPLGVKATETPLGPEQIFELVEGGEGAKS